MTLQQQGSQESMFLHGSDKTKLLRMQERQQYQLT